MGERLTQGGEHILVTSQQKGIYSLTNKINNMKFIGSTISIGNSKENTIKRLNNKLHRNIRLQKAWNEYGEKNFLFEVVEIIQEDDDLVDRRNYWINRLRSNVVDLGYNLEILKRPWEQVRDEWKKNKTWGVEGSIQEFLGTIIRQLDYDIEFAEDRMNHLITILDDEKKEWLLNYVSSPLFCEKQIKNKSDFLTENDVSLIGFSYIVDYLVFPKYKSKEEKKLIVTEEHMIRKKKSVINMDHRRGNERLFGDKTEIESEVSNLTPNDPNVKESEKQKTHVVATRHIITEEALKKYPELNEVFDKIEYLKLLLGQGLNQEARSVKQNELLNRYGNKQVAYMRRMLRDLSTEILIMKELLSGTIRFKRITEGSTVFNYDEDTGYFNDIEDNNGDYVLVSENKIDFSKEKHILELINHYSQLKQRFYDKPDCDMWTILFDLDELIKKTEFESYIRDILIMKIDGYQANEIIDDIMSKHGIELTEDRLSRIYNEVIPKMIVDTYLQEREDWIFTYKIKGTYKTCSKCKEVKLATSKYFSPNRQNKDGFHSYCRRCR